MGAKREAMRDIGKAMREREDYLKIREYLVTPSSLDTKENRKLNRELGLNKVNHLGNTRGSKSYFK